MIRAIREAGPRALLLEFDTLDQVLTWHQQLRRDPLPGQVEAVAAARTILLRFTARPALREARTRLPSLELGEFSTADSRHVELEIVYDGEDLQELASHLEMSVEALIDWHSSTSWTGAFGGFAPGFTYCVPVPASGEPAQRSSGNDSSADSGRADSGRADSGPAGAFDVPRRSSPRTAVPAGAVALAGEFSAVYPRVSPGGWQLIGHTPATMWDLSREAHGESPALVRPGDSVRYKPVTARAVTTESTARDAPSNPLNPPGPLNPQDAATEDTATENTATEGSHGREDLALTVLDPGLQTLIQDLGRSGLSDLGVSRAGVADEAAAREVNRLLGNPAQAAVLEALHGGLSLHAEATVVLAVAGAQAPLTITAPDGSGRGAPLGTAFALAAGETLSLGAPERGLRSVIGLRGGIAAAPVLGSVSADTMSGLGPAPLAAGDRLRTAGVATGAVAEPRSEPSAAESPTLRLPTALRFTYGPRADWFSPEEAARLAAQPWAVSQSSNRIGIRLDVPEPETPAPETPAPDSPRPLRRIKEGELPSEGVVRGSLQMPPAGTPVLFLNDHPVTGGYPVIGVVIDQDLPRAAQLAPGDQITLVPVDPDTLTPLPQTTATPDAEKKPSS
ncbi:carboxyltransferase domain-containing protein [Nesterenkonia sp. E16_7]|uniref:5-oxoprolinase subunit B/C family protein n=1 Tax=unclassified Nesterenkonia TaxID=2629769 RepID=UPI001A92D79A|nr:MULTISPECIES: carboxyltransferase domain-containing protein [unclassified Nesterenkonia]MBO0594075.1 carboxyltransferase domain-containing protein [Nesterenkonia sp. E16_10]MBO0597521.1 carboxyltransferase domain-containing protein [Nesterenkonia sp. E16_7]